MRENNSQYGVRRTDGVFASIRYKERPLIPIYEYIK